MAGKAKRIRDAVRLRTPMDPEFYRGELLADHPLASLVRRPHRRPALARRSSCKLKRADAG